jgi:hypothetical protein
VIRDLETGPGRAEAMDEVFSEFGDLINLVADTVHRAEPTNGAGEGEGDLALTEGDGTGDGGV